jgi:ketosteroid isomerase-like protein
MAEARSQVNEFRELDIIFERSVANKDAGTLVNGFYSDDAVLMPPNHPAVEGKANIQTFLQGLMDQGATGITLETIRHDGEGDLAYAQGKYVLTLTTPDGTSVDDTGKYVVTYRRQTDGGWRVVTDFFNSDNPPAA